MQVTRPICMQIRGMKTFSTHNEKVHTRGGAVKGFDEDYGCCIILAVIFPQLKRDVQWQQYGSASELSMICMDKGLLWSFEATCDTSFTTTSSHTQQQKHRNLKIEKDIDDKKDVMEGR